MHEYFQVSHGGLGAGKTKGAQVVALIVAAKVAHRIARWHWTRHRTERALVRSCVPDLVALLSSSDPRTAQAALVHLAHDLQASSNLRLRRVARQPFPRVSDVALSRSSAAVNRARAQTVLSAEVMSGAPQPNRPASCLSISSVDTTTSSVEQDVCVSQAPAEVVVSTGAAAAAPSPTSTATLPPCSQTVEPAVLPAHQPKTGVLESNVADETCRDGLVPATDVSRRVRTVVRPQGAPVGGRALEMLTEQLELWDAFAELVKTMLCSATLRHQRDAAWAVQVAAFASEELCQRLIDAGALHCFCCST